MDSLTQKNTLAHKRYVVNEQQFQMILEHKIYNLMLREMNQKDEGIASSVAKKQIISPQTIMRWLPPLINKYPLPGKINYYKLKRIR